MSCHTERKRSIHTKHGERITECGYQSDKKMNFRLKWLNYMSTLKKNEKFKIHSFHLALFATPLCRLNFLHQNTLQKLNSRTKSVFKSTLSHKRKQDK